MLIVAILLVQMTATSETERWIDSSNVEEEGVVYSDTRRRAKKARRTADVSMSASWADSVPAMKAHMRSSMCQDTGVRAGLLYMLPCTRRMAVLT